MAVSGNYTAIVQVKVSDTELEKQLKTVGNKTTINIKVNTDTKAIDNLKTSINNTSKEISNYSNSASKASKANNTISTSADKASKSTNALAGYLERTKKVFDFGLSTASLGLLYGAINEAKEALVDFDKEMIEFTKVSDLSGESLDDYIDKLGKMGEEVGKSKTQMLESATLFKKTGATEEEAAQLAKVANTYINIADEIVSATEASKLLVAMMKAYNVEVSQSESIIDTINAISNAFGASSADIATAIPKVSATLAQAGNSMSESIALLTAGVEVMPNNASRIARGLRSITLNLQGLDDAGNEVLDLLPKMENDFNKIGITLEDSTTGQLKSTFDILSDLAEVFPTLDSDTRNYYAALIGGKTQVDIVNSILLNFNTALEANKVGMKSAGSAAKELERVQEGLAFKLSNLKAQFQELVLGDGGLTSFVKLLVDSGTTILKFVNSDVGQLIIKLTLLYTTLNLANKGFTVLSKTGTGVLIKDFIALKSGAQTVVSSTLAMDLATKGFTATLLASAKAWVTSPFGMATIGLTAIYGIISAIDYFNESFEESKEKLSELNNQYNQTTSKLNGLKSQLDSVQEKIAQMSDLDLSITQQEQLDLLVEEENSLKRQIALLKQKQEIEQREREEQAKKILDTKVASRYSKETLNLGFIEDVKNPSVEGKDVEVGRKVTQAEELKFATQAYKDLQEQKRKLLEENAKLVDSEGKVSAKNLETFNQNEKLIQDLDKQISEVKEYGVSLADTINNATQALDGNTEAERQTIEVNNSAMDSWNKGIETYKNVEGSNSELADSQEDLASSLEKLSEEFGISEEKLAEYSEQLGISAQKTAEFLSAMDDWNSEIDSIQDAYNTLSGAVEEYNSQGGLTLDTIQSILSLAPEYISLLQFENGQLLVNEEAIRNKVIAQAEEAKQTIYNTAIARLNALTNEDVATTSQEIGNSKGGAIENINANTQALNSNTEAELANAAAKAAAKGADPIKIDEIMKDYKTQIKAIDSLVEGLGSNFAGSMGKAKSATKGATNALKDQKDALNDLKADYDKVIDFIIDKFDDQIDAIEKAKDAQLKAIDDEIKSLEKEKDAVSKYWNDRIEKYKRANKELEDNIQLQRLQEALALAQQTKVKIYEDGKFGFQVDEKGLSEAEQNLSDYQRQITQEQYLQSLEDARDRELEILDQRIEALNDYRERVEEEYNKQIEILEQQKEQFIALTEQYNEQQEALLASQLLGANAENETWLLRLENLQNFVNNYNAILSQLNTSGGGSVTLGYPKTSGKGYASGNNFVKDNEIAVVGENPKYKELVIGSKLNNDQGVIMSLKRGDGVVNSKATNTLAGVLNNSQYPSSSFHNMNYNYSNKTNSVMQNFNFGDLVLPNVGDANSFVRELSEAFNQYAIQYGSTRT